MRLHRNDTAVLVIDPQNDVLRSNLILALIAVAMWALGLTSSVRAQSPLSVHHKTVKVDDLDIFYREGGTKDAPAVLLLHGFPTGSQMFRNLIPALANKYHLIAPDYPGFDHSSIRFSRPRAPSHISGISRR